MNKVFGILLVGLLAACSNTQTLANLKNYEAYNVDYLVGRLGPPDRTMVLNAGKVYVWEDIRFQTYTYGGMATTREHVRCRVQAQVNDQNVVTRTFFEGGWYGCGPFEGRLR